ETVCTLAGGGPGVCDGVDATCQQCVAPADCPATGNPCTIATCTDHSCGTAPLPDGTELPSDGNPCTSDVCLAGVAYPPADGRACQDGRSLDTRWRAGACVAAVAMTLENDAGAGDASSVTIEERYISDGAAVPGGTITLPTTASGASHACTQTGSADSEGY